MGSVVFWLLVERRKGPWGGWACASVTDFTDFTDFTSTTVLLYVMLSYVMSFFLLKMSECPFWCSERDSIT